MINESSSNISTEDCLEIKFVGKRIRNFVRPPTPGYNWSFTPSGRYCAQFRSYDDKGIDTYIFTVVDLVDRICFEIKIAYEQETEDELHAYKVDTFYFTADDELVIISGFHELVKQLVYRINYEEYKVELQDTITYTFTAKDQTMMSGFIAIQQPNFIRYDGTDYVVLINYGEDIVISTKEVCTYTLYMVPKNPADNNKPLKEYQIVLKKEDLTNFEDRVNQHFSFVNRIEVMIDESSCLIDGTKLMFSCKLFYNARRGRIRDQLRTKLGNLIGANFVVDLTKLKDIWTKKLDSTDDIQQLMNEQDNCYAFVQRGDLRISDWIHLQCCEKDVGVVCIVDNKLKHFSEGPSSALVYPSNMTDSSEPIRLKCKIESEDGEHRYLLHPGGALLHFEFANGPNVLLRVLKCLKPNLMLLAKNRSLFYKNTLIKDHPAYRLCFREYYKYSLNSPNRALKRKRSE